MAIRRPNQPVEVQIRSASRTGSIGGQTDTWVKVRDDFAFVRDTSFREASEAGRFVSVTGKEFRLRRDDTLTAENNRVLFDGLAYNIRSIKVDDRNTRSPYTILRCESGVAQ